MPTPSRQVTIPPAHDGVSKVLLNHWKDLPALLSKPALTSQEWFWRGQREAKWPLNSSLDRMLKLGDDSEVMLLDQAKTQHHLNRFKSATRGIPGFSPPPAEDENKWWALGQHNGLATPLLDWTETPFVALFFAFEDERPPTSGRRSVWAISRNVAQIESDCNAGLASPTRRTGRAEIAIEFVRPTQSDNLRLMSQKGLFTKTDFGKSVEGTIRSACRGQSVPVLIQFSIRDEDREQCINYLEKKRVTDKTVYPDFHGACQHCNRRIEYLFLGET